MEEEEQEGALGQEHEEPTSKKKGRGHKRGAIIAAVVIVVVIVAGVGFAAWHEQPSFCNAICHSPMDDYVEGYYSEDETILASQHENQDVTCLQCHDAELGEQVSEAITWVSGSYSTPLEKRSFGTSELCYDCHDSDEITAATADYGGEEGLNPHSSHYDSELECGDCHSMHGTSTMACNECHNLDVPEGWE